MNTVSPRATNGVNAKTSYRPDIDGLRALAVVAVIANHFNKDILPSGYLGVDIFFVISGFAITASLAGRPSKNLADFLLGFYTRRIKRLVPALLLFVLISAVLIALFNPNPVGSLKTGITSLVGFSNLYLLKQSTDYFAASTALNSFSHTWSLGVEEQFYFLFPLLVWFTGFGRQTANGPRNLFLVTAALSVASLSVFIYLYPINQPAAYFLMPTRLWELSAGCLLFLGLRHSKRFVGVLGNIPPSMVMGALVAVLFAPRQIAVESTVAVVILTAILIACIHPGTLTHRLLTHSRVRYIGLISYSLYLWHWVVLSLSHWTIGIHWWSAPFQFGLMLLLAAASYRYIETPFRRSDWSVVRWRSLAYGMGASAGVAVVLVALVKIPGLSLYVGRRPPLVAAGVQSLTDSYSLAQVHSRWGGEKCVLSNNSQVGKKILIEDCTLGNFSNAKRRVLVIGNSFSAAFTQAFDDLVVSDGYSVTITSSWDASPVQEVPNQGAWNKANDYYWKNVVPSLVNRLRPGDWLFLISDMERFSPSHMTSETKNSLEQLESGLAQLSGKLSKTGIRLAVLHGNPFAREANCQPASAIKQWFSPFGGPCKLPSRSESLRRRDNLNKVLVSLEAKGMLRAVDLFDVFCPDKDCTYNASNGQLLYRDEYSHPSVEGVRLASPIIRKALTS